MKEKLKEVFGNIRSRVTSAFMHSASARGGEREVEELFVVVVVQPQEAQALVVEQIIAVGIGARFEGEAHFLKGFHEFLFDGKLMLVGLVGQIFHDDNGIK